MYKQRLHVKKNLKRFLNSIKLFLLFSTEISSTEMSHMLSTEMSWYRLFYPWALVSPNYICYVKCIFREGATWEASNG